ncbi:hypothetical protein B0T14DRAFT_476182 [Immersiella caudata]|uniref:Midasin n=1 Tax=Immersiella caudata TaxID=314043 RepID=A0AA39WWL1_9PEZI|nr:hypothetical protein B0T14DRAFT_476182 [Immersiella caudata]
MAATIDVSAERASLLADAATLQLLPPELLLIIQDHNSTQFLEAVAKAALSAPATDRIFCHFDSVFADICARWIISLPRLDVRVLSSFARILPFSPSLSVFFTTHLQQGLGKLDPLDLASFRDQDVLHILLALWRLNNFDKRTYAGLSRPSQLQSLFAHQEPVVRYLAIRIFCQLHNAADLKLESLLEKHIPKETSIVADLDGRRADYTFLSLYEDSRVQQIQGLRSRVRAGMAAEHAQSRIPMQHLTSLVVTYGKMVLPRPLGPVNTPSTLALTPVTVENLENLASLLQRPGPVLLHGLSGSGKTSLVHEVARELGKERDLVTLHLNEQTDAKMLLGLYATGSRPGAFEWRAGVLTTAVREGRWVLIEDLDRAPTEVMSTLLPLIERGELLIPGRGERIQAPNGFRIFATVRTLLGMNDRENLPSLIGLRMWQLLHVKALPRDDLRDVINSRAPLLHKYVSGILAVFDQLLASTSGSARLLHGRAALDRPIGTRDLLKWCLRLEEVLRGAGCKTGDEPVTDTTRDRMFLEAVDCFVGNVHEMASRDALITVIAKEMHLSPERVQHYLTSYVPDLEDTEARLTVGRASFTKPRRASRMPRSKRPFATTTHAKKLLEQISVAVRHREPLLLVGETGIGKTTVIQQLADSLGHQLIAVNLSQQSESGDLLGGFKPISAQTLAMPIKEEFEDLFEKTGVSADKNKEYLDRITKKFAKGKWKEVSKEWRKAPKMFEAILSKLESAQTQSEPQPENQGGQPAKRRRMESTKLQRLRELKSRWDTFSQSLDQFDRQISAGPGGFAFAFVEGKIVRAARNGDWVLLDEINLASPDTLESIAGLFQPSPSLLLSETGEIERIQAHLNFRVFGAMNPATDVGKRDLPQGLRSRFTEIYVHSPDKDKKDLLTIIKTYLKGNNSSIDRLSDDIADLYLEIKKRAESKLLVDQANEVPHFSLRTLTRVLTYANDVAPFYGLDRAVYEGFCMGFTTLLSEESEKTVMPLIHQHLLKRPNILTAPPKKPIDGRNYISFKNSKKGHQYWLLQGNGMPIERDDYIITPYVERNLLNLVRATSTRRYPILIQGPTSSGKTSMIEYLANYTGNKFVRINNHEHTDLQEYLGTYVSDSEGKLKFQEGLLVQAMREGSWIVLDELNLAPTDVLEALNRLLDDNRELLIPETQEVVRPAENFCLFATQNPPGLYGGRKVLSRAFRNRFLELHFDDIPESELETILQKRSRNTAPSDCHRIVQVYKQLTRLRQESRVFEQKNSFATLRDLFRWAMREVDTRQEIADNGFMLLAERVRKPEEREEVRKVIEEVFKVKVNPEQLYDMDTAPELRGVRARNSQGVIWTRAMRRLYVLVKRAIQNNEPVLLVGETGCGKTTVCQLLSEFDKKELHIVNAHQNTETGDLIGSHRPVRNRGAILDALLKDLTEAATLLGMTNRSLEELQAWYGTLNKEDVSKLPKELKSKIHSGIARSKALFEWSDGSLVHALKEGTYFLLDEISLADDSVLERLNSVLEPHRSLLLAEKGVEDSFVKATDGFQFFATMNPGGDFGKKELSPALRNRFTEVWVPALSEADDVHDIIVFKLDKRFKATSKSRKSQPISRIIVEFASWFGKTFRSSAATAFSVRDILAWVYFMNTSKFPAPELALLHGAAMVFIDTIGANPSALLAVDPKAMEAQRQMCLEKLSALCGCDLEPIYLQVPQVRVEETILSIGDFSVARVSGAKPDAGDEFGVPTTKMNAMRVVRALQGTKPILLEGNPGVGKTTLITALARACNRPLIRINLSDQTDLMDLFGTDVPVEGAEAGNFRWQNAPFLEAMQNGWWVLLDEMNLASQTVLEGLNACLDHRGEVYIAELDQVFKRHPEFKLFAAQNPHHQGGGRKGLPSSFVNRFIVVYSDVFTKEDLLHVTAKKFDKLGGEMQHKLIEFMSRLDDAVVSHRLFGSQGSPWEFNLRDTLRWGDLLTSRHALHRGRKPDDFLDVVIRQRFRSDRDRLEVNKLFAEIFGRVPEDHNLYHDINPHFCQVGIATQPRNTLSQKTPFPPINPITKLREIESILIAVEQDLPCILVGPSGSGKSALLHHVAALTGRSLVIFALNADVDAMDLIGGFEQADPHREVLARLERLHEVLQEQILRAIPEPVPDAALDLMGALGSLSEEAQYESILAMIEVFEANGEVAGDLATALAEAASLLRKPLTMENPRFEWLDGVIVRAVETGAWLVLDNANLCSASVLDRLNPLLERPNGSLSINEHSGPGGEPRIVNMHPDFRIFLTVDPRYGELSRAMRNRSVEIYLGDYVAHREAPAGCVAPVDGGLQRYHAATRILRETIVEDNQAAQLALDILSLNDIRQLEAFVQATRDGLDPIFQLPATSQGLSQVLAYTSSDDVAPLRQAVARVYSTVPDRMLMPLHPLLNSPMLSLLEQHCQDLPYWLATCYEFYLDIQTFQAKMESHLGKVNISKPSSLNRLQRSFVAGKVASLSRDSTSNAVRFLTSAVRAFKANLTESVEEGAHWQKRRAVMRRLLLFWKRTFEALIRVPFEEARFQAHLTLGASFLQATLQSGPQKMLQTISGYLERDFVVGFKLSTGLSMEVLWNLLRPDPIPNPETLAQVVEIEKLAGRFDELRWRADVNVSTLRTVQDTMARVYAVIRTGNGDAATLVSDLKNEISSLEAGLEIHAGEHKPFFADCFEGLRQALTLHHQAVSSGSEDVDVLADIPTIGLMRLQSVRKTALQVVDCLLVQNQETEVRPWTGALSKALLVKYDAASSASLKELRSIEVEMPIMGKALTHTTGALASDALAKAEVLLLKLMSEVLGAHDESYSGRVEALYRDLLTDGSFSLVDISQAGPWLERWGAREFTGPQHVVDVFKTHFCKALISLAAANKGVQPRSAYTSIAWVQFALGCIKLFVPDKIFDPHHRAQVEAEEHRELRESLQKQIAALENFEVAFTGRKESIRSKLVKQEAAGLGEPPAVQEIYRPGDAELRGLQGEFNNVLNTLVKSDVSASHLRSVSGAVGDAAEELALTEQNVVVLIGRLMGRFEAYQDLTMPLVSFLRCLQMGLSLGRSAVGEDGAQPLMEIAPFIGGTIWKAETAGLPLCSLEFLSFIQAVVAVEGVENLPTNMRSAVHESLAQFHSEWSRKLEADRKAEKERTSLFRHKGSLEDEEEFDQEEFEALFPDYYAVEGEDEDDKPKPKKKVARGGRELSVLLAEAHERIFLKPVEAQESVRGLCTKVARRVARENRTGKPELDALLLPATLMVFEEQSKAFGAGVDGQVNYNFYTDANLAEVRKLLNLVNGIRKRFLELQGVDEIGHHQSLADVVSACEKVLEMGIDDPLASILPGVEKLHSFMYEWHEGGWASKAHKAAGLYERLRDTICDWRRLELSSWSRLLDTELKKCHDDAKSWWFIAYGAVILEPCGILQKGLDLKDHAVTLLGILESYFASASVGQFASRLELLRQLKNQLDVLILDEPQLSLVRDAVQNFTVYCGRYEKKVAETIRTGRLPLDRTMKDVLLMMKWRDKNIESLRDSARKSHQKLFKLVRKFRAVLEQPVRGILEGGLPEEDHAKRVEVNGVVAEIRADTNAIQVCQRLVTGVQEHPQWTRMANLDAVLKAMAKHGLLPTKAVRAAGLLEEFTIDLVSSMSDLRKETPGTLTDENKELVRHLKTRKTNLYADTLKTLRAMGFSRNLGTNILSRQSSTQLLLVGSGLVRNLNPSSLDAIEYYYHKTLDLAPRFRYATQDHNEDLNRDVVARSVGYLEGILYVMLRQRQFLSRTSEAGSALEEAIAHFKELSASEVVGGFTQQKKITNSSQVVCWVVQILKFAIHLVELHGKLGGIDNGRVCGGLSRWVEVFAQLEGEERKLPHLPENFSSAIHEKLREDVDKELGCLRDDLGALLTQRPDLAFVTQQVQLWTDTQTLGVLNGAHAGTNINEFAASVLTLSSKVLVAFQNFQKAAQELPQTTDETGWLLQYSDTLEKSIDALRTPKLTSEIQDLFRVLSGVNCNQPTTALLRLVLPVLQQYASTCSQNLTAYAELHRTTCRLGYTLSNSFVQITAQGFCSPKEQSDEKAGGDSGKVESGTGLGDGEGAEDISKDIKPDEDLSELAQDKNNNREKGDIEDNKDAIDMGEDDLEGELGSVAGDDDEEEEGDKSDDDSNGDDEDREDQAGDVDDLDPTAVDEKMWDGSGEDDAEKDQEGEGGKGKQEDDQSAAAAKGKEKKEEEDTKREESKEEGEEMQQAEGDEEMEGEPGQEEEGAPQEELNRQDHNVEENETLALPEDMNIDVDDEEDGEEDDLDDLADMDEEKMEAKEEKGEVEDADEERPEERPEEVDSAKQEDGDEEDEGNVAGEEQMDVDDLDKDDGEEEQGEDEAKTEQPRMRDDGDSADQDNAAPSDVQNGGGQAQDDDNLQDEQTDNKAAQREQGAVGKQATNQENAAAGEKGAAARADQEQGAQDVDDDDANDAQPFKKLGDALERWYKNQRDIRNTAEGEEENTHDNSAPDMAKTEFQHLQDENAEADAQALGTATDEEVRPMDDAMAIDNDMDDGQNQALLDDTVADEETKQDVEMEDMDLTELADASKKDREDGRSGVATRQGALDVDEDGAARRDQIQNEEDEKIEETSTQLSATHLNETERTLRDFSEALNMWTKFQTKTHPLSLSLSSQLRLILTPSQSTKLSGSFRTGKRLNIKKIIPYIASSYKRDKIWMRRSIPSKRAYQILLCVDDSSSMGENSSSGRLALESLVMVARALTMLEVGQVGVLGFGTDVFVAHDLTAPLFASHDAGARALQHFTFRQEGTDMVRLLRSTIDQFRDARLLQAGSSSGEDLWQLALILSDGLVQSKDHARLRPLLREAMEQRVMVVFIVMDDAAQNKKGRSVLELNQATFDPDGVPVIHRYLDSFPFPYYLIVHHLEDLPGALAALLRTWFAEVNA